MNRAKIQDYIDRREEQRSDLYHFTAQDHTHFTLNGHPYELVKEYRDGFNGLELAKRFSNILSKYDYIVGDWGYDQLRLRGFYDNGNPQFNPEQGVDTIEDYLYEDCNFGCAYFIIHNDDVRVPRHRHRGRKSPVIKERRRRLKQPSVRHRSHQHAERVKGSNHQQKFVIHKRQQGAKK
ncbi:YutD family protein [Limosilactobacillus sp.]|uniref:YutD family protein n=1 Tax=Limosilactobacillus sp. TaxID=2773925 RepID=UPI003F0AE4B5